MSVFESIIYGLVSGLTEFLPISSQGHQAILLRLFGQGHRDPVRDILVHLAIIFSLLVSCRSLFVHLRREHLLSKRRRRKATYDRKGIFDLRFIKTAAVPMLLGMLVYIPARTFEFSPTHLALFFAINGIILIIPEYMAHGNKDAKLLTGLDSILTGLASVLSSFPGISRVGAMGAFTTARGAERQASVNWILALSLPALVMFLGFDVVNLIVQGFDPFSFATFIGYILAAAAAFCGGYFGVVILRYLTVQIGYIGFAYYSWGAAMFSFVLYLIV